MATKIINYSVLIGFMVMVAVMLAPVSAAGGITHKVLNDQELDKCNTAICTFIKNHYAKYMAGVGWPDVTVPYYYTRFDNYQSTHTWLLYKQCLAQAPDDDTKAICYGIGSHLAVDSAYHNYLIPEIIKRNILCFDWICHPVEEVIVENDYIDLRGDEGAFMAAMTDKDVEFLNHLTGKTLNNEVALLKDVYGKSTFYTGGYGSDSGESNWKYEIYKFGVASISNPIFRLAFLDMNSGDVTTANEMARNNLQEVFNGRTPPTANPTGAESIKAVDGWLGSPQLKASILLAVFVFSVIFFILKIGAVLEFIFGIGGAIAGAPKAAAGVLVGKKK